LLKKKYWKGKYFFVYTSATSYSLVVWPYLDGCTGLLLAAVGHKGEPFPAVVDVSHVSERAEGLGDGVVLHVLFDAINEEFAGIGSHY